MLYFVPIKCSDSRSTYVNLRTREVPYLGRVILDWNMLWQTTGKEDINFFLNKNN